MTNSPPASRRVLVVDDDAYLRLLLSAALEGVELLEAWRLSDALTIALDTTPDAVIVDRRLPDGDGLELVRQFRADQGLMEIPILFLTATHDEAHRVDVLVSGADEYLSKAGELSDLTSIGRRLERLWAMTSEERLVRRGQLAARASAGETGDLDPLPPPAQEEPAQKRRWFRRD